MTRERVRQIEKAAIIKMRGSSSRTVEQANLLISEIVVQQGGVALVTDVADTLGVPESDLAYLVFLALLSPGVDLVEEDDHLELCITLMPVYARSQLVQLINETVKTVKEIAGPATLAKIAEKLPSQVEATTLEQIMRSSKKLAHFDGKWGLITWPEVNPRSIRDKTYLVLTRHGKPLHFQDIAKHVRGLVSAKRDVTVQAVHNELIKDVRFILIGRGIYALAEWGYTPGTVAEII